MDHAQGGAFVLGPGEGRSIDLGNFTMSVKAAADETSSAAPSMLARPIGGSTNTTWRRRALRPITS